jgi:hypothetical protein
MIRAERAACLAAEARAGDLEIARAALEVARLETTQAHAARYALELEIERLKLQIAKLRRQHFGTSSERSARLDQLMLALEDLEESAAHMDAGSRSQGCRRSAGCAQVDGGGAGAGQACPPTLARALAAPARGPSWPDRLRLLWWRPAQARRGGERDPRAHPGQVGRAADRAREVQLCGVRDDHRDTSPLPCHSALPRRPASFGRDHGRQVRAARARTASSILS